jgi:hypothetical protein
MPETQPHLAPILLTSLDSVRFTTGSLLLTSAQICCSWRMPEIQPHLAPIFLTRLDSVRFTTGSWFLTSTQFCCSWRMPETQPHPLESCLQSNVRRGELKAQVWSTALQSNVRRGELKAQVWSTALPIVLTQAWNLIRSVWPLLGQNPSFLSRKFWLGTYGTAINGGCMITWYS